MTFKDKGYEVVKNFIETKGLFEKCKVVDKINDHNTFDPQCPLSPAFYYSPVIKNMLEDIKSKVEKSIGLKLFKTYNYWRMYKNGETLDVHVDRHACEISVTLYIGGDPWDIYIKGFDGVTTKITQEPGDALIYRGCELEHWREEFEGDNCAQVFLHYVNQDGPSAWCKDDIKKCQ